MFIITTFICNTPILLCADHRTIMKFRATISHINFKSFVLSSAMTLCFETNEEADTHTHTHTHITYITHTHTHTHTQTDYMTARHL